MTYSKYRSDGRISNALCATFLCCSAAYAQEPSTSLESTPFVVVGDSLSAGVQNFSLLDTQQPNGYASVIARQAGWPLALPLVPFPGAPNVLELVSLGPPIQIAPARGQLLSPRDNPTVQPTDIAVPGLTVETALTLRPSATPTTAEQAWATIVLGIPNLSEGRAPTEIEQAIALNPRIIVEWLGNNDALVPALAGQLNGLTPVEVFAETYEKVVSRLAKTGAKLITATIPDVTEVPYFTSVRSIAAQANLPVATLAELLGIGIDDYVRPSAQSYIDAILTGASRAKLPATCPAPLPDLGVPSLPCVLTKADAETVRGFVDCYNLIIRAETSLHDGVVVDVHALVHRIYEDGYKVNGKTLTTNFFGGLFTLDGIHPTNTGYAIIANEFIRTMNPFLATNIPEVNIESIFASDPFAQYVTPQTEQLVGQPKPEATFCFTLP